MSDRQLIADLLSALEYHTEQTRPIEVSRVAIEAAREYLRKPAQQESVGYVYSVHGERIKNACIESDVPNGTPLYTSPPDKLYEAGWNSALEMAAFRLQHDFKRSFGEDTLASIAVYIKEMKK